MNDKIRLLLKYIGNRFPEGCSDGNECSPDCPLIGADKGSMEDDLCELLSNQCARWLNEDTQ